MRKFFAFLGLIGLLITSSFFGLNTVKENVKKDLAEPVVPSASSATPSPAAADMVSKADVRRSIFVPYWGLDAPLVGDYDEYLYFGIAPSEGGIDEAEEGHRKMGDFNRSLPDGKRAQLVLRMLNSNVTFPILKDPTKQDSVIRESIGTAKDNNFSGIVLDLEISAAPFDSLINQVNVFTERFYKEARESNLEFSIMFYGDTFHRIRPFDVKELSKNADKFFIMSYDFSKSRGNPGPNFPLKGREVYGYDMTEMISDFLRFLPAEKTTVVFGFFGYDWEVDSEGVALGQGEPLTYKQIEAKFLSGCDYSDCSVRRKNDSRETEVRYKDEEGQDHIVWFEDMESVGEKEKYLREQGIGSFSFWAHSYF